MSEAASPLGSPGTGPSNLTLRIVSAIILALLALGLTYLGGFAFRLFASALAVLVFYEWTAMRPAESRIHTAVSWGALAVFLLALLAAVSAPAALAMLLICFLVALVHGGFSGDDRWSAYGIAYAGIPATALAYLRGDDSAGLIAILFLYAVVWATDILAYFVGRAVGGPKLAPSISPGKTWSGAAGGAVGGILAGGLVAYLSGAALPFWAVLLLALLLSLVSQLGDLFESMIKRRSGVKDSGSFIPGHGGVMDRVDGLVAAALVLYLLGVIFSGHAAPAGLFSPR
ncbi:MULTISPECIES: phosphatidate cytidylyltransferase [Chelativorans]|jgi:phosphatidate cytidylyltransferase|uniref:Phosphatidate cytidylyltransferase n=1 Tax=Chelativorans sp. (strain BNC1) TaxID=266779 RepID=Q11IJ3_CHESB|nr:MULTISPECIES: CDP-archaeol synthase [Chelativorans]